MSLSARLLNSAYYFSVALFNLLLKITPFFSLRIILLRILRWKVEQGVSIHRGVEITSLTKPCFVGRNSVINKGVLLDNRRGIYIGENVSISQRCSIYTLGHDIESVDFCGKGEAVVIGSHAVLFSGATIMPGVTVGVGAVVLPCAVITKNLPDYAVAGGNPAVIKRYRRSPVSYKLDHRIWFGI
jgi:acetyltransferase-like isoleucine patch superfamily enzyme